MHVGINIIQYVGDAVAAKRSYSIEISIFSKFE